jgi:uncharacterized protein (TIGR02597 family)
MGQISLPLSTRAENTNQDIALGIPVAADQTLSQSNLFQSGAFVGSSSHSIASRQDELLVWNNAVSGKNKAADATYYYYTGAAAPGQGWRLAGSTGVLRDSEVVITAGKAFAIRKKSSGPVSTVFWTVTPSYVPAP